MLLKSSISKEALIEQTASRNKVVFFFLTCIEYLFRARPGRVSQKPYDNIIFNLQLSEGFRSC